MSEFELALKRYVQVLRYRLSYHTDIPSFRLDIEVYGRVDGDVNIVFKLGEEYALDNAQGGNLSNVFNEFIRRFNWKKKNQILCLPNVVDDEARI